MRQPELISTRLLRSPKFYPPRRCESGASGVCSSRIGAQEPIHSLLRRIRAGEELLIRDRDLPTAKIVPLDNDSMELDELSLVASEQMKLPKKRFNAEQFWSIGAGAKNSSRVRQAIAQARVHVCNGRVRCGLVFCRKMWAWPSLRKSPIAYANSPMSWLIRNPGAAARYRNAPSVVAKRVAPAPITPRPATVLITA